MSTESKAKAFKKVQSQRETEDLAELRAAAEKRGDRGAKTRLSNKINDIVAGLDDR